MISQLPKKYNQQLMESVAQGIRNQAVSQEAKNVAKKERTGRWTQREIYLFESLLERYGKNWKKIHEHLKVRSLAQIRSHAQKYFQKIGPKRVQEFERRSKLIQAYEILQNQKRLQEQTNKSSGTSQINKDKLQVKQENEINMTGQERVEIEKQPISAGGFSDKSSEIIKQQALEKDIRNPQQTSIDLLSMHAYPQHLPLFYYPFDQTGYYLNFANLNPPAFTTYGAKSLMTNPNFQTASTQPIN